VQTQIHRPLVAFAALVKISVFCVFAAFWLHGVVSPAGLTMVAPHLLLALVFVLWLRTPPTPTGAS